MKIPVILDTDIGTDIDDMWALILLLKSSEFDIKLITACTGDTIYRGKLVAKTLELAGRTDIPIGIGIPFNQEEYYQSEWIDDYNLTDYAGSIHQYGVDALINTILASQKKVTLICIGPLPNIAEAIRREPRIVQKINFVGMHGSIYKGYGGKGQPDPEANVKHHTEACQMVFDPKWSFDITITSLDTCGLVQLTGGKFKVLCNSQDKLIQALMTNYQEWITKAPFAPPVDPTETSSTLFDTVAIYLALPKEKGYLQIETLKVRVTSDGFTRVSVKGKEMHVAIRWKDLSGFEDFLVDRLLADNDC